MLLAHANDSGWWTRSPPWPEEDKQGSTPFLEKAMRNLRWIGLAVLAGWLGVLPGNLWAQYQISPYSSPYSPYLNLLRSGGSVTSNYYGLVRPQIQNDANLQQLQRQIQVGQQNAVVQTVDTGVITGQLAGFQTQGAYFRGAGFRQFGLVNAPLSGTGYSPGQRGLNTPGFYNAVGPGLPTTLPATTPGTATKPPGY
jgi:hypothetical protein